MERTLFDSLLHGWFALSAVVFVALQWITVPYGRHVRSGWGPSIPGIAGWIVMELPALATFPICFSIGDRQQSAVAISFLLLWELHYAHRTLIYPVRRRAFERAMPLVIVALGFFTNVGISYVNARWLFWFSPEYDSAWLADPRFVMGVTLFVVGFALNVHSDEILLQLRRKGGDYGIPTGGGFRWVSSPNYLGELVEWGGFALATWSLPGLAFFAWSASNLIPRAIDHHRWYRVRFADYPATRKALVPFLL